MLTAKVTQLCLTFCNFMDCSPLGFSVHGILWASLVVQMAKHLSTMQEIWVQNSPGKNIGEGCHSLLQGIFPTQGSNRSLLRCSQIIYQLSYQESPVYVLYTHTHTHILIQ